MTQAQRDIQRKLRILEQAAQTKNVSKTCRYYGISRTQFYEWKRNLKERGEAGLVNRKSGHPSALRAKLLCFRSSLAVPHRNHIDFDKMAILAVISKSSAR
ncbi:MAG: helix-turn-helix domain containing protein [Deltaproteobacteria bacterium]|nr:helix-turn-helix domain containing protein [Deltaproteobacteria bacterium]